MPNLSTRIMDDDLWLPVIVLVSLALGYCGRAWSDDRKYTIQVNQSPGQLSIACMADGEQVASGTLGVK